MRTRASCAASSATAQREVTCAPPGVFCPVEPCGRATDWDALNGGTVLDQQIIGEIGERLDLVPGTPVAIFQDDGDIHIAVWMVIPPRTASNKIEALQAFAVMAAHHD